MNPDTEPVASRVDADLKDRLERAAEERNLSLSAYLRTILREHVDQNQNSVDHGESMIDFVEGMLGDME